MDFGNSPRVQLTESFMRRFSDFFPDECIVNLETEQYNKVYQAVYDLIGYLNLKHFLVDKKEESEDQANPAETLVSPLTRYEKDVLQSAKENHIWINAMMCIRPTDERKRDIGEQILQMLNDRNNLILSDFDGTTFEELKQKELIVRINKS